MQRQNSLIATSPHYYKKLPELQLTIGDLRINRSEIIKNLGVLFDRNRTMYDHISSVCRKVTCHLRET